MQMQINDDFVIFEIKGGSDIPAMRRTESHSIFDKCFDFIADKGSCIVIPYDEEEIAKIWEHHRNHANGKIIGVHYTSPERNRLIDERNNKLKQLKTN